MKRILSGVFDALHQKLLLLLLLSLFIVSALSVNFLQRFSWFDPYALSTGGMSFVPKILCWPLLLIPYRSHLRVQS